MGFWGSFEFLHGSRGQCERLCWYPGVHGTDAEAQPNAGKPVPTLAEIAKKKREQELDQFTMYLGRPEKETKPWYADRDLKRVDEKETGETAEERREKQRYASLSIRWALADIVRRKDVRSKERNDPLTTVTKLLSTHTQKPPHRNGVRSMNQETPKDATGARIAREKSERERALALIAKSKAPAAWGDTPSTQAGGRNWSDQFERDKDRAGNRYFSAVASGGGSRERVEAWRGGAKGMNGDRGWDNGRRAGRSWEV